MPDDPRQTARPLTEADLLQAALITEADKVRDAIFWRAHGSVLTNRLLDAGTQKEGA